MTVTTFMRDKYVNHTVVEKYLPLYAFRESVTSTGQIVPPRLAL